MSKPKDYDEALEQVNAKRETLKEQKAELRQFKTENKIKRGKEVEDAKIAEKLAKKDAAIEATREEIETLKAAAKELKPRKERVTKYIYPEDCVTDADKKKFRAKKRREVKAAEKKEAGDGKEEKKDGKKKVVKKPKAEGED